MPAFKDRNIDSDSSFPLRQLNIPLLTIATSQTKRAIWIHKFTRAVKLHLASVYATGVTAALSVCYYITSGNEPMVAATIVVDAVPEKYKNTAVSRYLTTGGVFKEIAANTAQVFTAAHTINTAQTAGQFWGTILIQQNAADGVLSTKVISADQVYASKAAAEAAAATVVADAGKFIVGAITIQSKLNVRWTANTDDMTAASDVGAVTFYGTGAGLSSGVSFTGTVLTPSIDVTPVAFTETIESAYGPRVHRENQFGVLAYTSDGTGAAVNPTVKLEFLPYPIRGDGRNEV